MIDRAVDRSEQRVRRNRLVRLARSGREHAQIAIDLHRIGVDDRRVEAPRQHQRCGRLAARRRACNEEGAAPHAASPRLRLDFMPHRNFVATLVAAPQSFELSDALIARAAQALPGDAQISRLAAGAADLLFQAAEGESAAARARLAEALAGEKVDAIVQPAAGRRKRLLLADMDSTLIEQECVDELAARAGIGAKVAAITERAMRGEIAFEPALRKRVALLAGLPVSVIEEVVRDRIRLTGGARTLVATMRASGARTCMVSGGFTLFTDRIAAMIGFDESRANR